MGMVVSEFIVSRKNVSRHQHSVQKYTNVYPSVKHINPQCTHTIYIIWNNRRVVHGPVYVFDTMALCRSLPPLLLFFFFDVSITPVIFRRRLLLYHCCRCLLFHSPDSAQNPALIVPSCCRERSARHNHRARTHMRWPVSKDVLEAYRIKPENRIFA